MKHKKQSNFQKIFADVKVVLCKFRFKKLLCVIMGICVLAVGLYIWNSIPVAAADLKIPGDYGDGYGIDKLEALDPNQEDKKSFEGIICEDQNNNIFTISYDPANNLNGLVTLARISHTNSLAGYTFKIAYAGIIELDVKNEGETPVSAGSFFGIGNDIYPFKGTIEIGGAADTYIKIADDSESKKHWRFFFNNISNEAKIVKSQGLTHRLCSSAGSFVFCRKMTVTEEAGALDISGFYFSANGSGDNLATVTTNDPTAVFAGEVVADGANSFSVDLSSCFSVELYGVKSNNDVAGGLVATVGTGVNATITLPASLQFNVTSGGDQKNAGILIGSNNGNVIFNIAESSTEDAYSFTGQLNATGSAGLIGANETGSTAVFNNKIIVNGLQATGLRAGGIAGTGKGPITVKSAEIKNSTFTKIDSTVIGRLGGAIGGVDNEIGGLTVLENGTVILSDNTFSASNSKDCYIGGYIGGLKTSVEDKDINFLTISNTTITGSGSVADKIGGLIGYLETSGNISVSFENDTSFTFKNITQGICGGAIGEVVSPTLANTVEIKGKEGSYRKINCSVTNGTSAMVGGLVGKVTSGYLKTDNLSLENNIVRANLAADLVGVINPSAVLDVGSITLKEANGSVLAGKAGQGSVVRLGGTITDSSATVLNLVYEQDASLIYKDKDCNYVGNPSANNDIGNYGQVVRNDTLQVIEFNNTTHEVTLASPLDGSGEINITNAADFAKLAITFHTKGAISGVTGADYPSLFTKTINLTGDVPLENTGIEQLTPSNDISNPFKGKFYGNGNTVTLAIGQNISGNNVGVKASANNKRSYLGFFAALKNATVQNVNIGGNISLGLHDADQYVGSLAAKTDGTLSIQKCNVATEITVANGVPKKTKTTKLYVGGTVGYIGDVSTLSATGCELNAKITDSTDYTTYTPKLYFGGLGGYVKYTGSNGIDFKNNTIKTTITKSSAYTDLKMGGLVGELVCSNYVKADLSGTTATDVDLNAPNATNSAGGILGYSFDKCHIILNESYSGTVYTGNASLGGLLYTLNGRLTLEEGFSLNGTTLTSTGELKGLLLADGKAALVTVKADASGFDGVTANGFDLFVGENIEEYTSVDVAAAGGIVTVETGDGLGKLANSSSSWYTLINARQNTKTRYYFNIAGLENKTDSSATINSTTDLLYWNVYDYAQSLPDYVKNEFFKTVVISITSATADIDMTDYCFYPTKKEAVTINFSDKKLNFGNTIINSPANQFFGLQAGLLSDITDGGANTTVNISKIKLGGKISLLENDHDGNVIGSGALICGTVSGSNVNNNRNDVKLTLSNITLSGLAVKTDAAYRPMLINRIASYVEASVTGVKQENYTERNAASSLIGKGGMLEGSTPSSFVKMIFSNIVLDGKKDSTVFTRATLFDDVLYENGSGSFIYNFNFDEDWNASQHKQQVTYGAELYFNEDQHQYFDKNININPNSMPTESTGVYDFSEYLPFVYDGYELATGKVNLLLSVNRKGADLTDGWGTYSNPYIINSAKQLEYISKLLSGNNEPFSDGWQINFPQGDWNSLSSLDLTDCYTVQAENGELSYSNTKLSRDLLLDYLSYAYFKLANDTNLTLSSGYAGLGSTTYPFHGVVHGNGNTVTMTSPETAIGSYGYGFINVANGCAIYNLTIKYDSITLSSDIFTEEQTPTSHPTDTTLTTALPHFGGAIAWVVGGDNLLDTVTVSVTNVTAGACHTVCGGYVGLVSGGGILLSDVTDLNLNKNDHLYHNNYIGRVLEGYAISVDGKTYNNSKVLSGLNENRADFIIPVITKDTLTTPKNGYSNGTFELATNQDLLLFSFGMNSGAFAGNNGYGYGLTSLSRYGNYHYVGNVTNNEVTLENGKYIDDTNKTSVIAKYFNVSTDLRNTELTVNLTATEYNMTAYGNAFRGMNGVYGNTATYKIVSFGGANNATLKLDMDMLQYAVGKKDGSNDASYFEADSIRNYGLFGNIKSAVTFQNLVLTGKLSVSCINSGNTVMESDPFARQDISKGCSVGGFVGLSNGAVTITNTYLNGITLNSPDVCGGFVGRHASGNFTVESGCSYENATVKGKRHSGGVAGYINSGVVSVTGLTANDSVIETRRDLQCASGTLYGTAGGVLGHMGSGASSITLDSCTINKTAVVYTANYKNTGDYVASGGLVGFTEKSITANNCTVDGCVVLAVSNFSSGNKFPDTLIPSNANKNILSDSFKNTVVYNGENQNVANLLAWMMEQTATDSNGYSVGAAGGILGEARNNAEITLNNCTVSASKAPSAIIAFNDAGGLVGEQRGGANVNVAGCRVKTDGHDMYIVGGPRAAGAIAYRNASGTPTYTINDVQITGTAANPIRILGIKYSTTDAAGLIGDINKANLTAENCKVSYCIIGGSRAAGAWSNVFAGSNISFRNIDVSNNLIYSKHSSNYAGGLFCNTNAASTVDGAYIGNNYIVGVTGAGELAGQLLNGNTLNAKYVILDDNVIRKISANVTNFTFAAKSLVDGAAANALFNTSNPNFTNVGLIVGNNAGNVTAIAVSCFVKDEENTQRNNFGTGSSTGTVVYAAYGAGKKYTYGNIDGDITPQQKAIEEMKYTASIGGDDSLLYGDSVTDGTPNTISNLNWWPYKDDNFTLSNTAIAKLNGFITGATVNSNLPLFCLNEKTDETVRGYLNILTAGGFSDALNDSKVEVTVDSKRYSVDADGALTALGTAGSVVYSDGKFIAGVYDNLEGDSKTLTVLSINYNNIYTMHLAIYYHRSVNLKTFVIPLEGEQYYLPSFWGTIELTGSKRTDVSFGSPFTLYVEYDFNDLAKTLEQPANFYKQIELTSSEGNSDINAKIEKDTQFVLIDLNAETPAGYKYYTLTLSEDTRFINFNSFTNWETTNYIKLTDLTSPDLNKRVCKDTSNDSSGCIYTEKYLLVVFPVLNNTDKAFTYNMKAVIDEEHRTETNVVVKKCNNEYGQVFVWSSPEAELKLDKTDINNQFSNDGNPIKMNVTTKVTFANGYITALQGQNGAVYGTHILRLRNQSNQYVELPMGTSVKVENENGSVLYDNILTKATSQIRLPHNEIKNDSIETKYSITLDFSNVSQNDFNTAFASSAETTFTLVDSFYLSTDSKLLGNFLCDIYDNYTVDTEGIRLAVVPNDNRHLGINLLKPDDVTNDGKIDFSVIAGFDAFAGKIFEEATVSFSVSKKVYNSTENVYNYEELNTFPENWHVTGGETLKVTNNECSGDYTLEVDVKNSYEAEDLTNYRLNVTITATATDGTKVTATDYFVFLLCKLETEPPA